MRWEIGRNSRGWVKFCLAYLLITTFSHASYNKDGNFRSCSPGRAGRAMGNGSFERSYTPHEHTLWPTTSIRGDSEERSWQRTGFLKMASKRPNGRTIVPYKNHLGASPQTREARLRGELNSNTYVIATMQKRISLYLQSIILSWMA